MDKKSLSQIRSEFFDYFKSLTPDVLAEFADNFPISNPEGHMLSGKNISFLKFQASEKINFTVVAGYRQWLKFDRQVRKGQHGFWIFIPAMIKTKVEENGSSRTVEEFDRFLMAKVFDISQTWDINSHKDHQPDSEMQSDPDLVPEESFA
jgi:antirestriction protein ArdC